MTAKKGREFTDEDRKKAAKVKEFKKTLLSENQEQTQDINKQIQELEEQRSKKYLRELQENNVLNIQLENKRMRDELTGVSENKTNPEQQSDLEIFDKVMVMMKKVSQEQEDIYKDIKKRVIEEMVETNAEPESATDGFLKTITEKIISGEININKQPNAALQPPMDLKNNTPAVKSNSRNPPSVISDSEVMAGIPDYILKAIKDGHINIQEIENSLITKKGAALTGAEKKQIKDIFNKIKKEK